MDETNGGYFGGYDGGMGYPGVCMPMDNVGFSGSEVIGNQLPSGESQGAEATADVSYINEGIDLDLDEIKMPKIKFKPPKPVPSRTTTSRRFSSNHGGSFSILIGVIVGIGIFLVLYFFVIN